MTPQVCCLCGADDEPCDGAFVLDGPGIEARLAGVAGVVLPDESEQRAESLLAAGAPRAFVGEAALLDSGVVERLVGRFGGARVGVYVAARRMEVSWSFDTTSNADFKVVTPSRCEPAWEILHADGRRSGALAGWWLAEMLRRGASAALLRVDICDDTDLNLCAGLVEDLGERLWLGPLDGTQPALGAWIAYGKLGRIVLPAALFAQRETLLPPPPDCAERAAA